MDVLFEKSGSMGKDGLSNHDSELVSQAYSESLDQLRDSVPYSSVCLPFVYTEESLIHLDGASVTIDFLDYDHNVLYSLETQLF